MRANSFFLPLLPVLSLGLLLLGACSEPSTQLTETEAQENDLLQAQPLTATPAYLALETSLKAVLAELKMGAPDSILYADTAAGGYMQVVGGATQMMHFRVFGVERDTQLLVLTAYGCGTRFCSQEQFFFDWVPAQKYLSQAKTTVLPQPWVREYYREDKLFVLQPASDIITVLADTSCRNCMPAKQLDLLQFQVDTRSFVSLKNTK